MNKKRVHKGNFIDNRGTSIVELLVVMAIMAVLVGSVINIVGYLSGKQAKQCAYKMDAVLAHMRMETMSKSLGEKDSVYTEFKMSDGKIYAVQKIRDDIKEEMIASGVIVVAKDVTGSEITLAEGTKVGVYFSRATGALYNEAGNYCEMKITQGRVTYVVKIEPTTGKISYERE